METQREKRQSLKCAEVVVLSGVQHTSGVGQRLPCAAVCSSF